MRTIAFTTGLDPAERPALATAAALAVASRAKVVTVHATAGGPPTGELPHPEALARSWGHAIACDSLVHTCCEDVTDTLLDALRRVAPDLVVAGTHQRGSLSQLLSGSVAESVARNVTVPTLVVPLEGRGLADEVTGALDLRRIVVPAGDIEATRLGLLAAAWLLRHTGSPRAEVIVLHVEDGTPMPSLDAVPEGLRLSRQSLAGSLETEIERAASELDACLVVMATRGHDGVLDTLLGSHTERVLRAVRCPVLVVPVSAALEARIGAEAQS
jgi:nucleotide-binding universal stress UspA family protein